MAWKKHFKTANTVLPAGLRIDTPGATMANQPTWLPEVYQGPGDRLMRYMQYDQMDLDDAVNAALDTIAEFSTQSDPQTDLPFTLDFSEEPNPSELKIVEKTLRQWVKLNQLNKRIFGIFRSTIKFGDQFFVRDPETFRMIWVDPSKVDKVIVNESEGKKPEVYFVRDVDLNLQELVMTKIGNTYEHGYGRTPPFANIPQAVAPQMYSGARSAVTPSGQPDFAGAYSQQVTPVDASHMVHISLSDGMDGNWPFGNSILEAIYKVYKQKELLEDSILIYRVHRAPERRVFTIDVGDMPANKAHAYLERVKLEVQQKRIPNRDENGGSIIDATYNPMCISLDTKIPLMFEATLTLSEIIEKHNTGNEMWAYSCCPETGKIVPGLITWAGVTRKDARFIVVMLSNGKSLTVTPDHKIPVLGKGFVKAEDLSPEDHLIAFNKYGDLTFCEEDGEWKSDNEISRDFFENQSPENKDARQKTGMDVRVVSIIERSELIDVGTLTIDGEEEHHNYHTFAVDAGIFIKNSMLEDYFFASCIKLDTKIPLLDGRELALDEIIKEYEEGVENYIYSQSSDMKLEPGKIVWAGVTRKNAQVVRVHLDSGEYLETTPDHRFIREDGSEVYAEELASGESLLSLQCYNEDGIAHKVEKVEHLDERFDTGDITIETESGSHIFATSAGVFIHNSADGRGSNVTTLPGGCFSMDTKVSLLDGRELSIREIEQEISEGKILWTYSCEPKTGKIVPGLISWAGVTQKSAQVMKLTLDSGEEIICTPDHKFPQYDCDYRRAGEFKVGDSLIPLYRDTQPIDGKTGNEYEVFFDNAEKDWKFTHRMVADYLCESVVKDYIYKIHKPGQKLGVRHHIDFNRLNNDPTNLCFMQPHDHFLLHAESNKEFWRSMREDRPKEYERVCESMSRSHKKWWKNLKENRPEEYEKICSNISKRWEEMSDEEKERLSKVRSNAALKYIENLTPEEREIRAQQCRDKFIYANIVKNEMMRNDPEYRKKHCELQSAGWTDELRQKRSEFMVERNYKDWSSEKGEQRRKKHSSSQQYEFTHDMIKFIVDFVSSKEKPQIKDVLEALNASEHRNILMEMNRDKKIRNANLENGFTPVNVGSLVKRFGYKNYQDLVKKHSLHNHRIVAIEYLDEPMEVGTLTIDQDEIYHDYHNFALSVGVMTFNSQLGEIDDLKYFNNKMLRALRVPSAYWPTGPEDGTNVYTDGRVGTAYIQEYRFTKYCQRLQQSVIEMLDREFKLFLKHRGFMIDSSIFTINFTEPQNFAKYRLIEIDNAHAGVFSQLEAIPYLSKRFMMKRYLGLEEDEILENERLWKEEQTEAEPEDEDITPPMRTVGVTPFDTEAGEEIPGLEGEEGIEGEEGLEGEEGEEPGETPAI